MFDLNDEELKKSLAETIAWCATQPIAARLTDTPELRRFHSLKKQAGDLMHRAYATRQTFWNRLVRRDYSKTTEWKMGEELLHQAWQIRLPRLASELRSADLNPGSPLGEARSDIERQGLVRSVVAKRSELLRSRLSTTLPYSDAGSAEGRLLVYVPEENLADGAAEVESNWFFDTENAPPWDSWVAYSNRTLLSWVPARLVPLVQRGIDVNPEECIRWLN